MKKLAFSLVAAVCAANAEVISVGASVVPHADILRAAAPELAKAGYELKVVEYTDWVVPNLALDGGELDANYFQTTAFMQDFNANKGGDLVGVLGVHVEPMGAYSAKFHSLAELPKGAQVCLPNDPVNEDRALRLLASGDLVALDASELATPMDLAKNEKSLKFSELEAAQLPRAYAECDLAVINANYALQIDLNPRKDSLIVEQENEKYANIIATKASRAKSAKTQALIAALKSDVVKNYIEKTYEGKIQYVGK